MAAVKGLTKVEHYCTKLTQHNMAGLDRIGILDWHTRFHNSHGGRSNVSGVTSDGGPNTQDGT